MTPGARAVTTHASETDPPGLAALEQSAELEAARLELRATVRRLFERTAPEQDVRRVMDGPEPFDAALWSRLSGELGALALLVPEEFGGAGYGPRELGVVLEESGRALACLPLLSTGLLAVTAVLLAGDTESHTAVLPGIADGSTTVALGLDAGTGRWSARDLPVAAETSSGWELTGVVPFVLDGAGTDLVLVPARDGSLTRLFLLAHHGGGPGTSWHPLPPMDLTRPLARLELRAAPATPQGPSTDESWLGRLWLHAIAGLAAEQVGCIDRVLEMTVDHVQTRIQFGRPIGSFQAVKHRCADMLVAAQSARSTVDAALLAASAAAPFGVGDGPAGGESLAVAATLAGATCSEALTQVAGDALQLMGGIGFTWDHPIHLFLKRAKTSQLLFGNPALCRSALGDALGIPQPGRAQPDSAQLDNPQRDNARLGNTQPSSR